MSYLSGTVILAIFFPSLVVFIDWKMGSGRIDYREHGDFLFANSG